MTQLTIKHDVLAIEVKQDITARKGDILVVSSDGTYGVAVLPGVSFGIAESGNVVTSPKKALPKISAPSNNKSHRQKGRLDEELPELNEREFKYLDLLSKYEEPCTTKEIAVVMVGMIHSRKPRQRPRISFVNTGLSDSRVMASERAGPERGLDGLPDSPEQRHATIDATRIRAAPQHDPGRCPMDLRDALEGVRPVVCNDGLGRHIDASHGNERGVGMTSLLAHGRSGSRSCRHPYSQSRPLHLHHTRKRFR